MTDPSHDITRLLNEAAAGNDEAARAVFERIYGQLNAIADLQRRRIPGGETLRSTALVHEAYLRIASTLQRDWKVRSQFYFIAARAMRDILVESARRRAAVKRGGALDRAEITLDEIEGEAPVHDVRDLHRVLQRLEEIDEQGHQIVMLRYFVGLSIPEIADTMALSSATIARRWRFLRIWLVRELRDEAGRGD